MARSIGMYSSNTSTSVKIYAYIYVCVCECVSGKHLKTKIFIVSSNELYDPLYLARPSLETLFTVAVAQHISSDNVIIQQPTIKIFFYSDLINFSNILQTRLKPTLPNIRPEQKQKFFKVTNTPAYYNSVMF
jgi:hypothetical protein